MVYNPPAMAVRHIERLMDLRTVQRNIQSGLITKEQYDEYLATLPDVGDNAEALGSGEDEDDDDDDEDEDDEPIE